MKKIAWALFIAAFFLLRPYVLQGGGPWYNGDDQDYFAHASSIAFGQFPSYAKEYLTINPEYPQSSIGAGLLALPFVVAGSLVDRLAGSDIVLQRTAANIPGSWSQYGFVLASCFYFCLACFLLYRGVRYHVKERYAFWAVLLLALCQGLPLFAFRRPIFSHAAEFFLQSLFVFFLLKNMVSGRKFPDRLWQDVLLGVMSAFLLLTRYNDIGFSLLWPAILLIQAGRLVRLQKQWPALLLVAAGFMGMVAVFKVWPETVNSYHPYAWAKDFLLVQASFFDLCRRLVHVFLGLDWGLVYTAPYLLIGCLAAFRTTYPAKKYVLWLLGALAINVYVFFIWGSQGGWYGYRYILASAAPLFVLPLAVFIQKAEEAVKGKLSILWALIAVPPVLSMVLFEGNNSTLDLYATSQFFGRQDITNNLYQSHAWETFLFHVGQFGTIVSKGGAQYVQYLAVQLPQKVGILANVYFRQYPVFDLGVFVKVALIYAMPFLIWMVWRARSGRRS